ncbi:hypothetical protein CsSME_00008659 [Camellia sinensis var. sinensis]
MRRGPGKSMLAALMLFLGGRSQTYKLTLQGNSLLACH